METGSAIKSLPSKKTSGSDSFIGKLYQTFKKLTPNLLKLFQKLERREHFQTHFVRSELPLCQSQTRILEKRKSYDAIPNEL
jgi:hypothetical protein